LVRNQDDEYNYRLRKLGVKILLADDVRSRYYSRATLPRLWRQYFQYGYWKVRVLQKHPRQMQMRQFMPPLLIAVLLATLVLLPLLSVAGYLLAATVAVYSLAVLGAGVLAARKHGWKFMALLPIAFAILHLAYGSGFLIGLLKFWNRWGEADSKFPAPVTIGDRRA